VVREGGVEDRYQRFESGELYDFANSPAHTEPAMTSQPTSSLVALAEGAIVKKAARSASTPRTAAQRLRAVPRAATRIAVPMTV